MTDVASRTRGRDSSRQTATGRLLAVEGASGADIDYAMLAKIYGPDPSAEKRYSPAVCLGETKVVSGDPNRKHISTSSVERQNLTMRSRCAGLPA